MLGLNGLDRAVIALPQLVTIDHLDHCVEVYLARIRRITHKSVGPEARFRYHFSSLFAH